MSPLTDEKDRLQRALEKQDEDAAELKEILSGGMTQEKINAIIAARIIRICKAQVYQNHNSTIMASRMTMLAGLNVTILFLVLAHILWGQQISAQTILGIITTIFK